MSCPQIVYCDLLLRKVRNRLNLVVISCPETSVRNYHHYYLSPLSQRTCQPSSFKWSFWIHDFIISQNSVHSKVLTWTTKDTVACWCVWQTGSWRASSLPQYTVVPTTAPSEGGVPSCTTGRVPFYSSTSSTRSVIHLFTCHRCCCFYCHTSITLVVPHKV